MPIFSTQGTVIGISTAAAARDADQASIEALTFTPIGETETLGTYGDTAERIDFTSVKDTYTRSFKGTRSPGEMELTCGLDPTDAGQLALMAAERTDDVYGFEIVFNDAPSGGTPSKRYFTALVGSINENPEGANNLPRLVAMLWRQGELFRVHAST